jgi:hypothetical protein
LAAKRWEGVEFCQQFFLVDLVEALGDICIQHIFGFQENSVVKRFNCIMTSTRLNTLGIAVPPIL